MIFGPAGGGRVCFGSGISIKQHEIVKIISFVPGGQASCTICIHYANKQLLTASIRIILAGKGARNSNIISGNFEIKKSDGI